MAFEEEVFIVGLNWARGEEEALETSSGEFSTTPWYDAALDDRSAYDAALHGVGLSEQSVLEALAVRDDAATELSDARERLKLWDGVSFYGPDPDYIEAQDFYREKREAAERKLRQWWKKRVKVIGSEPQTVTIPVFMLGTPWVQGCKAEWKNEIISGFTGGWTLHVAGSGFGSDSGHTYIRSASFEASNGEHKVIFCQVDLRVEHIEIQERRGQPVQQWRIDLASMAQSRPRLGLVLLAPDSLPARGPLVDRFPLAGDPSDSLATYTHKYSRDRAKKVSVGIKVHGVELGLTAISDFGSSVEIKYTLRTGSDYVLFYAADCDGLLFGPTPASP